MKNNLYFLILMIVVLALLPACTPAPTTAPTLTLTLSVTETVQSSATLAPSLTDTPIPTVTPLPSNTSTPTATQTVTPSETPRPSFAGFQVSGAQDTNYGLLIGFHIPGIKEAYRLTVNGSEYKCDLNTKAPDSMFCYGTPYNQGQTVKLAFYPQNGDQKTPIFETSYKIALLGTATLNPETLEAAGRACQIRGVHTTCETEYRRVDGGYCTVATCYDLCGYYYSFDNCAPDASKNGYVPFTTPPATPAPK